VLEPVRQGQVTRGSLSRSAARWWLAGVVAIATFVYAPSLHNGFAGDDRFIAMSRFDSGEVNPTISSWRAPWRFFGEGYWAAVDSELDPVYRPVTVLTYALVYQAAGKHAGATEVAQAVPQHAINVLLHLLAVVLTYRLLRAARAARGWAIVGALVFALHAIHSEVVAAVVGRAELLTFCLGASGLLVALGRGAWRGVLAAVLLFLCCGAKESGVVWIPFLGLYGMVLAGFRRLEVGWRSALWHGIAMTIRIGAAPLIAYAFLRWRAVAELPGLATSYAVNPLFGLGFSERAPAAITIWGFGLWKTLWPTGLRSDYGVPFFRLADGWLDPRAIGSAVVLGSMAVGSLSVWRRQALLCLGGAAFLAFGFTTSNLPLPIGTVFGERLYYTPSVALAFAAAFGASRVRRPAIRWAFAVALVAWLAVNAVETLRRNAAWSDDRSLFAAEVAVDDPTARAHLNHAMQLGRVGDAAGKERHLAQAVSLYPGLAAAWSELGLLQLEHGRLRDAEASFRAGLDAPDKDRRETFWLLVRLTGVLAVVSPGAEVEDLLVRALRVDEGALLDAMPAFLPHLAKHVAYERLRPALERLAGSGRRPMTWAGYRGWLALVHGDLAAAEALLLESGRQAPSLHRRRAGLWLADTLRRSGRGDAAWRVLAQLLGDSALEASLRSDAEALAAELRPR
jgi:tetratricopeptide (TPR) repeat protein